MSRPNGVTLWTGPSPVDGAPIAVILTGLVNESKNRKTGPMLQTWILRTDVLPTDAIKSGADASICGACPLRGIKGQTRACYVNVGQAPQAIYRAYHRGAYPDYPMDALGLIVAYRAVRFGAYGDPAMAPLELWQVLARNASNWTGYTHQWRTLPNGWSALFMASTDADDRAEAQALGWRTFSVSDESSPADIVCPATRAENPVQCIDCGMCKGTASGAKSIVIAPHGSGAAYV